MTPCETCQKLHEEEEKEKLSEQLALEAEQEKNKLAADQYDKELQSFKDASTASSTEFKANQASEAEKVGEQIDAETQRIKDSNEPKAVAVAHSHSDPTETQVGTTSTGADATTTSDATPEGDSTTGADPKTPDDTSTLAPNSNTDESTDSQSSVPSTTSGADDKSGTTTPSTQEGSNSDDTTSQDPNNIDLTNPDSKKGTEDSTNPATPTDNTDGSDPATTNSDPKTSTTPDDAAGTSDSSNKAETTPTATTDQTDESSPTNPNNSTDPTSPLTDTATTQDPTTQTGTTDATSPSPTQTGSGLDVNQKNKYERIIKQLKEENYMLLKAQMQSQKEAYENYILLMKEKQLQKNLGEATSTQATSTNTVDSSQNIQDQNQVTSQFVQGDIHAPQPTMKVTPAYVDWISPTSNPDGQSFTNFYSNLPKVIPTESQKGITPPPTIPTGSISTGTVTPMQGGSSLPIQGSTCNNCTKTKHEILYQPVKTTVTERPAVIEQVDIEYEEVGEIDVPVQEPSFVQNKLSNPPLQDLSGQAPMIGLVTSYGSSCDGQCQKQRLLMNGGKVRTNGPRVRQIKQTSPPN